MSRGENMRIPFLRQNDALAVTTVDPLDTFASEAMLPSPGAPLGAPDVRGVPGRFSLRTVLDRRTEIAWFEAVAIVDAVCAATTGADGGASPFIPDLARIFIVADGSVMLEPDGRREPAVIGLARTLHALVAAGGAPAPLRLFIARWTDSAESRSAKEFSDDLRYFARSDGPALIAAVHQRCAAMPLQPVAAAVPPPALPSTLATRERRRRHPAWVVGAAAACVVAGAGAWLWSGGSSPRALITRLAPPEAAPLQSISAAGNSEGPTVRVAPNGSAGVRSRTADVALRAPRTAAPANAPLPTPVPLAAIASTARPETSFQPAREFAPGRGADITQLPRLTGTLLNDGPGTSEDGSAVYSNADADVVPPRLTYPQLPPPVFANSAGPVNTLEVIVGTDGNVERVRLVSPPRRLPDMMLLSGAKNWVFVPAFRNGTPVRYRQLVSWAAGP